MDFVEVAKVDDISKGQMKSFTVDGKEILVVNHEGKFYAMAGKCTHMSGELAQGKLEGKIVTCPIHGAKFDVTTGKCLSGPKMGLIKLKAKDEPTYEVRVENRSIKVNV